MTWVELAWFLPLMLAVSVVVGAAGRPDGKMGGSIAKTFIALTGGVLAVGVVVRLIVIFFA